MAMIVRYEEKGEIVEKRLDAARHINVLGVMVGFMNSGHQNAEILFMLPAARIVTIEPIEDPPPPLHLAS